MIMKIVSYPKQHHGSVGMTVLIQVIA